MPLGSSYDDQHCSIARALEVVGERWTPLILRDALFHDLGRFEDFERTLGVATNVLSARLRKLTHAGVFKREPDPERPGRHRYRLTPKGRELAAAVIPLMQWGDRHVTGLDAAPVVLEHTACGDVTKPYLTCSACGEPVTPESVRVRPGPGVRVG